MTRHWTCLLSCALLLLTPLSVRGTESSRSESRALDVGGLNAESGGSVPVASTSRPVGSHFEPNLGQTTSGVRFVSRMPRFAAGCTDRGFALSLPSPRANEVGSSAKVVERSTATIADASLAFEFVSGRASRLVPEGVLPGVSNYIGGPHGLTVSNVPQYRAVRYERLYEGIDAVVYGNDRGLEYDFVVQPGADPSQIRLRIRGASAVNLADDGALVIEVGDVVLRHERPIVFEESPAAKRPVACSYQIEADGDIRLALAAYDASFPLVVDPTIVYVNGLGGADIVDYGAAVALDAQDNAYLCGYTFATNFPATAGAFDTQLNTVSGAAFIAKVSADGNTLLYATYLEGVSYGGINDIALGLDGSAYVTGIANASPAFPTTPGAYIETAGTSPFVARVSPDGSSLIYSTYLCLGGTFNPEFNGDAPSLGISIDETGRAFATGRTSSIPASPFPTTPGAYDTTPNPSTSDAYIVRLNPLGTQAEFSTVLGGTAINSNYTFGTDIAIDSSGVYVTGYTDESTFPTTPGAFDTSHNGFRDGFVAKLSLDGGSLLQSTFLGGTGSDRPRALALASTGQVCVTGDAGANFPTTPGAYDSTSGLAIFVSTLTPNFAALTASTLLGGVPTGGADRSMAVAFDANGNTVVTGTTRSSAFPTTAGAFDTTFNAPSSSSGDAFVTKLNASATALVYSTFLGAAELFDAPYGGGAGYEGARGLALDSSGRPIVVGSTCSTEFPHMSSILRPPDRYNAFVTRLSADGSGLEYSTIFGGDRGSAPSPLGGEVATAVTIAPDGNPVIVGTTYSMNFPVIAGGLDTLFNGVGDCMFATKCSADGATLLFSTFLGSGGLGTPFDVAVDSSGEVVLAGIVSRGDLPTTSGAFDESYNGGNDAFVARLNNSGSALVFATFLGGTGSDYARAIALSADGSVVVGGDTQSVDLPVTGGAPDGTYGGFGDGFLARLSPTGASLEYCTFIGAGAADSVRAVAVDSTGRSSAAGSTSSSGFPVQPGAAQPLIAGGKDGFVVRLNPAGSAIEVGTFLGGISDDECTALAIGPSGVVFAHGRTLSLDFPTTAGAFDETHNGGGGDVFVTRLTPSLGGLVFSTYIGSEGDDFGGALALDRFGNATIAGKAGGAGFPLSNDAVDTLFQVDGYLTTVRNDGSGLLFSTFVGGVNDTNVMDVAIDEEGSRFVVGGSTDVNFATRHFGSQNLNYAFIERVSGSRSGVDVRVELSSDSEFVVGVAGTYTVTVSNDGVTSTAGNLVVNSTIAAGLNIGGAIGSGWAFSIVGQSVTATRAASLDPASSSSFDVSVVPSAVAVPLVRSDVAVNADSDDDPSDNAATRFTIVRHPTADLAVACTESADPVLTGSNLAYTLGVSNAGPDAAQSVILSDSIPAGTTFVSATTSLGTLSTPPPGGGGTVQISIASMAAATTVNVTITVLVTAPSGAVVTNVPTVSTQSVDPDTSDNFAVVTTGVIGTLLAGSDTPGINVSSSAAWFLRNDNSPGPADLAFGYGPAGTTWISISGDWNGDGIDSPGLYDGATGAFFLKNSSEPGPADVVFTFGGGGLGFQPLTGDWNGDGVDSPGLYDPSSGAFFLTNSNAPGPADIVFTFGAPGTGVLAIMGDWDGDGDDTVGIYLQPSGVFFLRNANSPGPADSAFAYGPVGAIPVAGDWDNNGFDSIGIYISASGAWFLRNTNTPGPADYLFTYGPANATPLTGDWDGQ